MEVWEVWKVEGGWDRLGGFGRVWKGWEGLERLEEFGKVWKGLEGFGNAKIIELSTKTTIWESLRGFGKI